MNILTYGANKLWVGICSIESKKYRQALRNIRQTQENLLLSMIRENASAEYGARYHFTQIRDIQEYQNNIPITEYDDYQYYIKRISDGEPQILTTERVKMFELSSGSTAPSKLIPYTGKLKKQFIAGINPWISNLYRHYPEFYKGKAYWSVTPVNFTNSRTSGGVPVGFEEDTEYFGFIERFLLNYLFAVPGEVKYLADIDVFRYVTLLFLLKERRLALISVWNPTFLTNLLKPLDNWKEDLLRDLEYGTINPPKGSSGENIKKLQLRLGRNPKRAKELQLIFALAESERLPDGKTVYESIWPYLKLISCWTDANANLYLAAVKEMFPTVTLQGKGLIATEGFVSLPYVDEDGARLAVRSHFFEFEEMDERWDRTGVIKLAHEIETGGIYSVILTTGGGLYRYRLRDIIKVTGYAAGCPCIRFLGKESMISDLCGEKLNEFHVRRSIEKAFAQLGFSPAFFMLAPETDGVDSFYVLFLEFTIKEKFGVTEAARLGELVETYLTENFHYKYCRDIGQLKPVKLFIIDSSGSPRGLETYYKVCRERGMRDGNIKLYALHNCVGWTKAFNLNSASSLKKSSE